MWGGMKGGDKGEDATTCEPPDPITRISSDTKAKKYSPSQLYYRDHNNTGLRRRATIISKTLFAIKFTADYISEAVI